MKNVLHINNVTINDTGTYSCYGTMKERHVKIDFVAKTRLIVGGKLLHKRKYHEFHVFVDS